MVRISERLEHDQGLIVGEPMDDPTIGQGHDAAHGIHIGWGVEDQVEALDLDFVDQVGSHSQVSCTPMRDVVILG